MTLRATLSLTALATAFTLLLAAPADAFDGCATRPSSSLVVNVKDKGAKGDGHANDTARIQNAIIEVVGTGGAMWPAWR
jgi:polygalacturonase